MKLELIAAVVCVGALMGTSAILGFVGFAFESLLIKVRSLE